MSVWPGDMREINVTVPAVMVSQLIVLLVEPRDMERLPPAELVRDEQVMDAESIVTVKLRRSTVSVERGGDPFVHVPLADQLPEAFAVAAIFFSSRKSKGACEFTRKPPLTGSEG